MYIMKIFLLISIMMAKFIEKKLNYRTKIMKIFILYFIDNTNTSYIEIRSERANR